MAAAFTHEGTFSVDGVWTTAGNWPTGGAKPGAGNEVVIRNTSFDLVTVNGEGAIILDQLTFDPTCAHKVGASGDRLTIDITGTPGLVVYEGTGSEAWFTSDVDIFVAKHSVFNANACVLKNQTAAIAHVQQYNGILRLDGGSYTLLDMLATGSVSARMVIDAGSTLVTVNCSGGTVECNATDAIATCNVSGGEFQHLAAQNITTLNLYDGVFRMDGAATFTTVNQYGGLLDLSRTAVVNKVLSKYNGFGGTLDLRSGGGVTITSYLPHGPVRVLGSQWIP